MLQAGPPPEILSSTVLFMVASPVAQVLPRTGSDGLPGSPPLHLSLIANWQRYLEMKATTMALAKYWSNCRARSQAQAGPDRPCSYLGAPWAMVTTRSERS